jgi:type I restriction enzyme R subunit
MAGNKVLVTVANIESRIFLIRGEKVMLDADLADLYGVEIRALNQAVKRNAERFTPGPVVVRSNMSSRNTKKKKFADYVLSWEPSTHVAVVEAKENNYSVSHGMQQALGYADILEVPSAFSSNGDAFASHNKVPKDGEDIETEHAMEAFPSPEELWQRYKKIRGIADASESLVLQPYHLDPSGKEPRYYQVEASTEPSRPWPTTLCSIGCPIDHLESEVIK